MSQSQSTAELKSARELIVARDFAAALRLLASLLLQQPDNIEALYMAAVCHRCMGDFESALASLQELKALEPDHGRAWQEEGHAHRDNGNADQALLAYSRATTLNPALVAAWREQLKILRARNHGEQLAYVQKELDYIESLPKPLQAVIDLIAQRRLLKAEDIVRQFLRKAPHHVEAMRLLADIGVRLGVLDDAEILLEAAVKLEPDNVRARIDYIQALRKRQKFHTALQQAEQLLKTDPENLQFQSICAIENMQTGDYEAALGVFDGILARMPTDPVVLTLKGHALKTSGRYDDAVRSYREAIATQPHYGEAYYSLANLKVYTFTEQERRNMLALETSDQLSHLDRVYLSFAMGKAFEDDNDYEQAFLHYSRGNALKKRQSRYVADEMSDDLEAQRHVATRDLFDRHAGSGCRAPDPIFIVGLPRAGSTLLEQIISSHSLVDGTLELPNIPSLAQRLRRPATLGKESRYPHVLNELGADELERFGEEYLTDTRVHRQGAPFFIDKMPNNFRHIGLIKLILPNAKIIDARRHPLACCVSGFRQLFAEGQEFSYDLGDLGQYYRDYVELMDHWDEVLPGHVLQVRHEDVVADLEVEVRRILEYCRLPFEPGCLEYYKTERNVRTPSSEQVRQPIFRDSVQAWRNYEPWLGPLREALGRNVRRRFAIDQGVGNQPADRNE